MSVGGGDPCGDPSPWLQVSAGSWSFPCNFLWEDAELMEERQWPVP